MPLLQFPRTPVPNAPYFPTTHTIAYQWAENAEGDLGIDFLAQLKASVQKAQGLQDGAGIELTSRSVETYDRAVLRTAMDVTAFVPGGDALSDVDD